jgi:hypothetical protein
VISTRRLSNPTEGFFLHWRRLARRESARTGFHPASAAQISDRTRFADVRIAVPPSIVLATDMFDRFLSENNLLDFAINAR